MSAHQRFDQLLLREIRPLHDRTFRVISAAGATRNGMPAQTVLEQLEAIRVLLSRLKPGLGTEGEKSMLYWALVFFVVALVAAFFGFGGIAGGSAGGSQDLFFFFLCFFFCCL